MIIRIDYQEADVMLDLWGGTSGTFDGIDLFNRVIDQRWKNYASGTTDIDRFNYRYDRDSNRTWKENTVSKSLGTPVYMDEQYSYDNLNRLTIMKRGQLSGGTISSPTKEQDWTLDKTGNWSNFTTKTSGSTDLNQTRTHSPVNQINGISETIGGSWVDPRYDEAGNTTTFPQVADPTLTYSATYDAWNRMVTVSDTGGTIATYQHDGRGRRIVKVTTSPSETRHFYCTNNWQDIEERTGSSTSADLQYVWGIRYVDELICRDASSTRLYALQDANFNLTSITNSSGAVQERYAYFPYGQRLIFDASWGARSSSSYSWLVGHQGLRHDATTGIIDNRMRQLHPMIGRFLQRDPLGYADGMALYEYLGGGTTNASDPLGLQATTQPTTLPDSMERFLKVIAELTNECPGMDLECMRKMFEKFGREFNEGCPFMCTEGVPSYFEVKQVSRLKSILCDEAADALRDRLNANLYSLFPRCSAVDKCRCELGEPNENFGWVEDRTISISLGGRMGQKGTFECDIQITSGIGSQVYYFVRPKKP
jgi:RHS repeat-associated protein